MNLFKMYMHTLAHLQFYLLLLLFYFFTSYFKIYMHKHYCFNLFLILLLIIISITLLFNSHFMYAHTLLFFFILFYL